MKNNLNDPYNIHKSHFEAYKNIFYKFFVCMYIKMVYNYNYIKMVNKYYQKNKEKLQKEARERYQNLSEEEKEKRQKMARDRYQNLSEEEREKKHQYHRV